MPTKAVTPTGKKASGKRAASPKRKTLTNKDAAKSTVEEDQARERVAARVDLCEQRPYLTGLSEGELDKILDFLQEVRPDWRYYLCSYCLDPHSKYVSGMFVLLRRLCRYNKISSWLSPSMPPVRNGLPSWLS
jgi:hypothetical protein